VLGVAEEARVCRSRAGDDTVIGKVGEFTVGMQKLHVPAAVEVKGVVRAVVVPSNSSGAMW
jgi:hypothetical protein